MSHTLASTVIGHSGSAIFQRTNLFVDFTLEDPADAWKLRDRLGSSLSLSHSLSVGAGFSFAQFLVSSEALSSSAESERCFDIVKNAHALRSVGFFGQLRFG